MLKVVCLATLFFKASTACSGYKVNFEPFTKCNDDSVVYPKDFSLTLDSNCQLIPKGCIISTRTVKVAKATYVMKKPPMPDVVGKIDLCKVLTGSSKYKTIQDLVEMGFKCPLQAKKLCTNGKNKIDLSKIRDKLPMLMGKSNFKVEIEHDNGKSCFQTGLNVAK